MQDKKFSLSNHNGTAKTIEIPHWGYFKKTAYFGPINARRKLFELYNFCFFEEDQVTPSPTENWQYIITSLFFSITNLASLSTYVVVDRYYIHSSKDWRKQLIHKTYICNHALWMDGNL